MSRRIIIGDIHGHYDSLLSLLEVLNLQQEDQVYFLGDLIDRGPDSAKVVDLVMKNNYHCLLGNHEQLMLDAIGRGEIRGEILQSWLYSGGQTTMTSYNYKIPQEHIEWMKTLPPYIDLGDIWLVHAGVHPTIPLEKQTLEHFCWIRQEFHHMTQPYFPDKLIISGHTITFTLPGIKPGQIARGVGWLGIETGAYHPRSGWLTALEIDVQKVYQINTKDNTIRIRTLEEVVAPIELKMNVSKSLRF